MKYKLNNKAFTIVELLTVIVIIAIIAGISIPAVIGIFNKQQEKKYTYHQSMVEQATKLYLEKYSTDLDKDTNCFNISYQTLIEENLLKEGVITCSSKIDSTLGGNIQITRLPSNRNTFSYRYYYKCKTTDNNKVVYNGGTTPAGCTVIK